MARIRSVKPILFGSYTLKGVSIEARFLFIGLFCEADDDGKMIDSPKRIAGAIFPHDEKVTEKKVDGWLNDLDRIGSIFRYRVEGCAYIMLPEWGTHQKISHPLPSVLPNPSSADLAEFLNRSRMAPEPLRPDWKGKGNGSGKGNNE